MYRIIFIVVIFISCKGQSETTSTLPGNRTVTRDSISELTITFHPSFTSKSVLHINRSKGEVTFRVDTLIKLKYGSPKPMSLSLRTMQRRTRIERFWKQKYIESLQMDTTKAPALDGMNVKIEYIRNGENHFILTGNVRTKRVNRVLYDLLDFLDRKATDPPMKIYLKILKKYL